MREYHYLRQGVTACRQPYLLGGSNRSAYKKHPGASSARLNSVGMYPFLYAAPGAFFFKVRGTQYVKGESL